MDNSGRMGVFQAALVYRMNTVSVSKCSDVGKMEVDYELNGDLQGSGKENIE